MGSTLSRHQADLLKQHFQRVFVILDDDTAGHQGVTAIAEALASTMPVTVISVDGGQQPD
jgi:DNA primase